MCCQLSSTKVNDLVRYIGLSLMELSWQYLYLRRSAVSLSHWMSTVCAAWCMWGCMWCRSICDSRWLCLLYRETCGRVVGLGAWASRVGTVWQWRQPRWWCGHGGGVLPRRDWRHWHWPCVVPRPTCQCWAGVSSECPAWLGQDAAVLPHVSHTRRLPHWLTVSAVTLVCSNVLCTLILLDFGTI